VLGDKSFRAGYYLLSRAERRWGAGAAPGRSLPRLGFREYLGNARRAVVADLRAGPKDIEVRGGRAVLG
jgi:hypothetical protein